MTKQFEYFFDIFIATVQYMFFMVWFLTVPDYKFLTVPDYKFLTVPDYKFLTVPDHKFFGIQSLFFL